MCIRNLGMLGHLGCSVGWASDFGSGHDLTRFVGSSPASGSGLTAQSLEPLFDSVSPSLSAPPPFMLSVSVSKINKTFKNLKRNLGMLMLG